MSKKENKIIDEVKVEDNKKQNKAKQEELKQEELKLETIVDNIVVEESIKQEESIKEDKINKTEHTDNVDSNKSDEKEVKKSKNKKENTDKEESVDKKESSNKKDESKANMLLYKYNIGDKVYAIDFCKVRKTGWLDKIENSYEFVPIEGEIERIVFDKLGMRYKLKNKAGSSYEESMIFYNYEEALEYSKWRNDKSNKF